MSSATDDELVELQKKYQLLEGDRKAYYETSQWTIKQNRDTLLAAKDENKALRAELAKTLRERGSDDKLRDPTAEEMAELAYRVKELRKRIDEIRVVCQRKEREIDEYNDHLVEMAMEHAANLKLSEDTPEQRLIRTLENRLDKGLVKYNEAMSIRRTYVQIVKRLKEERIGFENQLAAIERTLMAKEQDLKELALMSHDAGHAKEASKSELLRLEAILQKERVERERELAERRAQLTKRTKMIENLAEREKKRKDIQMAAVGDLDNEQEEAMQRNHVTNRLNRASNQSLLQQEQQLINKYEEAFRKIKEATGVSDVKDIMDKFKQQQETKIQLEEQTEQAQASIEAMNEEKQALIAKVDEVRYAGAGGSGSRVVVDEVEKTLRLKSNEVDKDREKAERLHKLLVGIKAGISHLADKLSSVRLEQPNIALSDETILPVAQQCEQKMYKTIDLFGGQSIDDEDTTELVQEVYAGPDQDEGDLSSWNTRIALGRDIEDVIEYSDDEVGGEDVPDRDYMKTMSEQMLDKATKVKSNKSQGRNSGGVASKAKRPGMQ